MFFGCQLDEPYGFSGDHQQKDFLFFETKLVPLLEKPVDTDNDGESNYDDDGNNDADYHTLLMSWKIKQISINTYWGLNKMGSWVLMIK